jgi:hypothetical protein
MWPEFIEKALDFTQRDLSKIPVIERNVHFGDLQTLSSTMGDEPFKVTQDVIDDQAWQKVIQAQKQWQGFISWLYGILSHNDDYEITLQRELSLKTNVKIGSPRLDGRISAQSEYHPHVDDILARYRRWSHDAINEINLPAGADIFLQAAKGFSSKSFLICPNCHKHFFNPSAKRIVKYCSSACQKTASVKRVYAKRKTDKSEE